MLNRHLPALNMSMIMKKRYSIPCVTLLLGMPTFAHEQADSLQTKELEGIVVEARLGRVSARASTYIPTARQKNSAQTGPELLRRMAIPQLGLIDGNTVTTNSGQSVDVFIDYVPASEQELSGMRMADVKRVEYYDFPDDPRFQGKAHVINFVMHKYSYGGYVKAYANEFFISNSGQLNLYSKFQYGKMTYDVAVGSWYTNNDHSGERTTEVYRLPQSDGTTKVFERISTPGNVAVRQHSLWPTFKAMYNSEKATMVNIIGANFFSSPKQNSSGTVSFIPEDFATTDYSDYRTSRTNSITYSGYWNFILPKGNSLNFTPYYSYSHTRNHTLYSEKAGASIENGAIDDSHRATAALRFVHDFGKQGNVTVICNGYYNANHTQYSGTAEVSDRLTTLRVGPGLFYNYKNNNLNFLAGGGFNYDHSKFGNMKDHTTQPWCDVSVQYAFNSKNSISADFHHATMTLASAYRSSAIIKSNPLMSYTGNPDLTPYKSYDVNMRYVYLPDNKWNLALFGAAWIVRDRYAYVYEASENEILRTISQNVGGYAHWRYGLSASVRLLDNSLNINGQVAHSIVKNGRPYNRTWQRVLWYVQAFYYIGGWNFGLQYQSPQEYCEGVMTGTWIKEKSAYSAIVGWGNSSWSIQARITNPFRWNWQAGTSEMKSANYDVSKILYNTGNHCFVLVSATYTLGFGKKIQRGNEASQQMGTASSILK